jgi:hypothetical protein
MQFCSPWRILSKLKMAGCSPASKKHWKSILPGRDALDFHHRLDDACFWLNPG